MTTQQSIVIDDPEDIRIVHDVFWIIYDVFWIAYDMSSFMNVSQSLAVFVFPKDWIVIVP